MQSGMSAIPWIFLFHLYLCGWSLRLRSGRVNNNVTTLERYDKTCGARTMPITLDLREVRIEDNTVYINSTVILTEDIPDDPKLDIDIERCKSKDDLYSCEPFRSIKSANYCNTLKAPGFYIPLFSTYEPPYSCPLKRGVYKSDRGSFDIRSLILLSTKAWYWKLKAEILERNTNRKLQCLKLEIWL